MEGISIEICNVCMRPMVDPRILPCAHSFCLKCLESSIASMFSPKCPTCEIEFQKPQGGLKDLKKNEFVDLLTNLKGISITCDSCKEKYATKFCVDCSFNYCSTCLERHEEVPGLRNHRLLNPTSTKDAIIIKKYSTCNKHSDSMNLFCENCNVVLCACCLALNHNTHKVKHVSEYFESVKLNIEQNLKATKEILESVIANYKNSMDTKNLNELKALNLRKKLMERGDDIKKIVDSIVEDSIKDVDEELMRHQNKADDVMKQLKDMENTLNAKIETFEQQFNNLNYENVVETPPHTVEKVEIIPKCSENFVLSLCSKSIEPRAHLESLFGTLRKAVNVLYEKHLKSPFESFALKESGIYFCDCLAFVKVYSHHDRKCRKIFNFGNELSAPSDVSIVNNVMYVAGQSSQCGGAIKIIKFDEALKIAPSKMYEAEYQGDVLRLSKSYDDNILLVLSDKILQLSESGDVMKTINLSFNICDALQIDEGLYVVCCETELCIVDHDGSKIVTYSPFDESLKISSPFRLAKDCNGNIYMSDQNTRSVFILNYGLDFITHHELNDSVIKMYFNETENILSVLTRSKIIDFGLFASPAI